MAETTFTFKDASGNTKTALAGQNGSSQLAPAATLYDASGAELKGQKARAASLPVALASEDAALLDGLETALATIQTLIDALTTPSDTQPISALSLPLPSGAATESTLSAIQTLIDALTTPADTQPISAASLPLPTGAATEAKQPTLGTAGTPSADVISVQGVSGGTSLPIDDNGGSLTVDGTVAISGTVAVTDNNSTLSIDDGAGSITVDGTVGATQSGTWTVQPGNTANTTPWLVSLQPATSGGNSIYRSIDVNATGANIKSSAGQVYGWYLSNSGSAARYVKLYNKASAPTVGTDTPVMTIYLPAGAAANVAFPNGLGGFSLGIGIGAVTGVADANTTAPGANEVIAHIFYK